MSIKGQGHSLTLVFGHSDFIVKCLTGLYNQVSDSGPQVPLVLLSKHTHIYIHTHRVKGSGTINVAKFLASELSVHCLPVPSLRVS